MLHSAVFLPLHMAAVHLEARTFPYKAVTYPLTLVLAFLHYTIEHNANFFCSPPRCWPPLNSLSSLLLC